VIELDFADGLGHLRLARPEAGNSIEPAWVHALADAVDACAGRADLRAVLISAEGATFSVGGELRHLAARSADLSGALEEMVPPYHRILAALAELACPVVCAVQGAAAGGGLGLTFCADLVIAADDARFVFGFARLGLSGDSGGTWFLPRLVGLRRAQELLFANRELSAGEALEWGLITRIVPRDQLQQHALATARELATGPTVAYANMRHLLRKSWGATLSEQLADEWTAMRVCGESADGREGVEAFVERRRPRFEGG
jgi:2-(1,2-epoxy-1,2-dihydrophenyl)acetyl-CoA isomerase